MALMTVPQARASVRELERICTIRPTVENLVKLSTCYFVLNDLQAAIPLIELAFQKDPNNSVVATNLALIWKDYGDHEGAHKLLKMIYEELDPDYIVAKLAYAESLLRRGEWEKAWPIYNTARGTKEECALAAGIPLQIEEWDGKQDIKRLAVIDEGGYGDSITYSRYLPLLTEKGISWIYYPFPDLRGFYERASWCGSDRLSEGRDMDCSDWTTTHSLPGLFNSTPTTVPDYPEPFTALPDRAEKYKLATGKKKPVLGLCWKGGESRNPGRKINSIGAGQAMRLVCRTDHLVDWVNLNHDAALPEPVTNVRIDSWEDLAGVILNMDAVVSVGTGPMCLANALGKKLLVILNNNSDWKFMAGGVSPFYPNAMLFRNKDVSGIENSITGAITYINRNWGEKRLVLVG